MIIHTVVFRTRHPKGSHAEKEFLKTGQALGALPMVENFRCFNQVSKKNEFDYGFSMEFTSRLAYDAYNAHPEHVEFVETRWKPEVEAFLETDYTEYQEGPFA